jgi:sulfur relay (sulfurtransferase) complex TusBCD TusD component (DsrE family)
MGKRITIIIQAPPYRSDNKAWDALRFAGACLTQEMDVRVHLLGDGAEVGRRNHAVPEGMTNLEHLLHELLECGLKASACGKALDACAIDPEVMIPGIERGSMKLLADWIAERDLALTF